ncbi:MAG: hypothetical protein F4Y14_20810 [Acidobacteria bacterium]|nr:hypothetical protein [Acidobacteriota bacterium]
MIARQGVVVQQALVEVVVRDDDDQAVGAKRLPHVFGVRRVLTQCRRVDAEGVDADGRSQRARQAARTGVGKADHRRFDVAVADDGQQRAAGVALIGEIADEAVVVDADFVDEREVPAGGES